MLSGAHCGCCGRVLTTLSRYYHHHYHYHHRCASVLLHPLVKCTLLLNYLPILLMLPQSLLLVSILVVFL